MRVSVVLLGFVAAAVQPSIPSLVYASSCSDLTDPDACTDHKYLGVHTCAYCETQRECHEVGSVYDTCADTCCASHATLSTCEASTYDELDHRFCSGWVNATVWQNAGTEYNWPEQTAGATNGAGVGLLFSGGGARAYTCAMGQVRALTTMGLMDSFEYIASSSGGSWFSSVYTYFQSGAADDAQLLGPYIAPEDLSTAELEVMPDGCMGASPQNSLYEQVVKFTAETAVSLSYTIHDVWISAVAYCYLEPFGITTNDLFAWTEDDATRIRTSNGNLAGFNVITPRAGRPYLVMQGTLLGPSDAHPFMEGNESYQVLDMAAYATGLPHSMETTYLSSSGDSTTVATGGLTETFAYGGAAPTTGLGTASWAELSLPIPDRPFTLARGVGISSMAPSSLFSTTKSDYTEIEEQIWDAAYPPTEAVTMLVGDGGDVENYGVISMLQRKMSKLVININCVTPLNPDWDPATQPVPGSSDIDLYVPALFGIPTDVDEEESLIHNQVFDSEEFPALATALLAAQEAGDGIVVPQTLVTVQNDFLGIEAGHEVQVLWKYATLPTNWYDALPAELQSEIAAGSSGPYENFPHYETLTQLKLSSEQVMLLANLEAWVMFKNEDLIRSFLLA